jgi:hypothetical protein
VFKKRDFALGSVPTSQHYKRRAEECRALAEQAHDQHERASILRIARQWELLAEYKEYKEKEAAD